MNLSYGCKQNPGLCRFKQWLYDPPTPPPQTFEQIYNKAGIPARIQY